MVIIVYLNVIYRRRSNTTDLATRAWNYVFKSLADHCLSKMWLHQCQINVAATHKVGGVYGYFNQNKTSQQTFSANFSQF